MLDSDIRALLTEPIDTGSRQQAFPLTTVDAEGFPYVSLVSCAEIRIRDGSKVLIAIRGTNTRRNLARDRRAALIAVGGTVAHYLTLRVIGSRDEGTLEGFAFEPVQHRRDSLGVELSPISYVVTAGLAELEDWERTASLLSALHVDMEG